MNRNHANAVDENKINKNAEHSEKTYSTRQLFTQNGPNIDKDSMAY